MSRYISEFGIGGILIFFKIVVCENIDSIIGTNKIQFPVFLRGKSTDKLLFYDIFIRKDYQLSLEFEPTLIIDLGANIGLASVYFVNNFPKSKIIAIEPEKSNFKILLRNSHFYKNIICLNKAIWNESANLHILDNGFGNWGFMVSEANSDDLIGIKSLTINEIIETFSIKTIDILKIDIEGSEKELFEKNYEKWIPITRMIIIELHDNMRMGASKSFFKAISNYNYSLTFKGENVICTFHH